MNAMVYKKVVERSKLPHLNVYLRSQSVSQSTYRLGIIAYKFFIKNFINSSLTLEISPLS